MTEYDKEMQEMAESMQVAFLNEEMEIATALRSEGERLTHSMFQPNADIQSVAKELNALAKKMLDFEANVINFEILNFFYADIGRVLLNLRAFDIAIRYALAGIDVNQSTEDQDGVLANRRLLLDIACFMDANKYALEMLRNNPELDYGGLYQLISSKPENKTADQEFSKFLRSKNRPKSFAFCIDEEKLHEEKSIRSLMKQMGDSRATVLKYLAASKQINKVNK